MNQTTTMEAELPGWSGLLVIQHCTPGEFFVLDGNPQASLLMGVGVENFRGQELEEIWPHARSTGLMRCICETIETKRPFDKAIGVHCVGKDYKLLRVRGLPISRDRVLLSFLEVPENKAGCLETKKLRSGYHRAHPLDKIE